MELLLIGGDRDGEWITTYDHPCPRLSVYKKRNLLPANWYADPVSLGEAFELENYYLSRFHGENSIFQYWLLDGLTADDAIRRLFARYAKGDKCVSES